MKKILLILTILPLFVSAQNSLLFEVTNPKNGAKSYLFGTMHVQDERAFQFNDSVFWAIDQSQKTAFELDMSMNALKNMDLEPLKELIDTQYIIDFGTYLKENFIPKLMKEVPASELAKKLTENLLPAYIELLKAKMSPDNRSFFVDQYLQNYAIKNKKEVIGIETYMEQIKAFMGDMSSFDFEKFEVSDKMIDFIKQDEFNFDFVSLISGTEQMITDYGKGNLDGMCNYVANEIESSNRFTKGLYHRIFTERNQIMFDRTLENVADGGIFIAVGAGHLCGDNGLLSQYKAAGYTIRPMNSYNKSMQPLTWKTVDQEEYSIDIPEGVELLENESGMEFLGISPSDSTYINTLFTTRGMARFKLTRTDLSEETDEEEFDYAAFMQKMSEMQADTSEEITIDEAVADEETPVEVVYEYDEIDAPEIREVTDTEIDEPTAEEAAPIIEYEVDVDEETEIIEYESYDASSQEVQISTDDENPLKSKLKLSDEQQAYFKEFTDSIGTYFKKEVGTLMMSMMGLMGGQSDTIAVENNGEEMTLVYNKSILGNEISTTVEKDNISYKLTITGDPALLKSEDIQQFFTSFGLK